MSNQGGAEEIAKRGSRASRTASQKRCFHRARCSGASRFANIAAATHAANKNYEAQTRPRQLGLPAQMVPRQPPEVAEC